MWYAALPGTLLRPLLLLRVHSDPENAKICALTIDIETEFYFLQHFSPFPLAPPTTPHLLYSIRHTVTFRVHVFPIVPIPISFRRFVHQFQIVFFPHFLQLFHFHPGTIGIVFTLLLSLLPGHMPHQTTTKTNTQQSVHLPKKKPTPPTTTTQNSPLTLPLHRRLPCPQTPPSPSWVDYDPAETLGFSTVLSAHCRPG